MSNTIDKPGFYNERQSGKYYKPAGGTGRWEQYNKNYEYDGTIDSLPPGDYIPLTPAATNAEAREEFVQWLLSGGAKERGAALVIADKAAEIFGRVAEVNGQRSCNLERLAEEVVDECDSTVTMDSDQRRKCKQHIFLALQQAWFGEGAPEKSPDKIAEVTAKLERYKRILIDQQDFCGAASVKDCLQLLNGFEPKLLKLEEDRVATLQETIKRLEVELKDAQDERDCRGKILDSIKEATGATWWLGIAEWANDAYAAMLKADSTADYASKLKREHLPGYIRQLAKERDHANRMYQTVADLGEKAERELAALKQATPAPEVIEGKGQRVGELAGWFWYDDSGFPTPVYKDEGDKFASEVRYIRVEPPTFPPRVPFTPPPKPEQHLIRWHRIDGTHVDMWATKHGDAWRGTEDGCTYTRVELLNPETGLPIQG